MLPSGRAAYVQHKDCTADVGAQRGNAFFQVDSLRVSLDVAQLELQIGGYYPENVTCDRVKHIKEMPILIMSRMGDSNTYAGEVLNSSCLSQESRLWTGNRTFSQLQVRYNIKTPSLLSSYDMELKFLSTDNSSLGCALAQLTPDIGPAIYWAALLLPVASFVTTFLAALCGKLRGASRIGKASTNQSTNDPGHFASLADCLSYIQFIFFSGTLSLSYPGFFRPTVGPSSWSTLMLSRGPYFRQSLYHGIQDGIYEINGTFGGTSGMELMTQVMGAPVSLYNWINILLISVLVVIFLALLQLHQKIPWIQARYKKPSTPNARLHGHISVIWSILRAFLSLFLLPITAWTTYQLAGAAYSTIYYTIAAALVVCILLVACWLAFAQFLPKKMGYFIIGDPEKGAGESSQSLSIYIIVTFMLLFSRGAMVGWLQRFGTAQLIGLIGCEAIQLVFACLTLPRSFLRSRHALLSYARCTILLLCISMLSNAASISATSVCGYVIIAYHILILVGLFLVPSACELLRLVLKPSQPILLHTSPIVRPRSQVITPIDARSR